MELMKALTTMLDKSGKSRRQISSEIGRAQSFIATTIYHKSVLKVDTLALIAKACGYELQLSSNDGKDVITIDPPKK